MGSKKKEGYYSLGLLLRILYLLVLDKKSETIDGSLEEDLQNILQTKVTLTKNTTNDHTLSTNWKQAEYLNTKKPPKKIEEVIDNWSLNNKVDPSLMFINLLILRRFLRIFIGEEDNNDFLIKSFSQYNFRTNNKTRFKKNLKTY